MDYGKLAAEVIRLVGGKENINDVGHCATRLRFSLKDAGLTKTDELKATDGVIGVVNKGGQYQVIIGNEVNEVYAQVTSQLGVEATPQEPDCDDDAAPEEKKSPVAKVLDVIAGSFFPIIPALVGAGMVKALLSLLTVVFTGLTILQFHRMSHRRKNSQPLFIDWLEEKGLA